jgi:hypothetical protein
MVATRSCMPISPRPAPAPEGPRSVVAHAHPQRVGAVVQLVPMETGLKIARLCPMFAGLAIQRTVERADSIPIAPGAGLALFCGYAVVALALGFWLVSRRDA